MAEHWSQLSLVTLWLSSLCLMLEGSAWVQALCPWEGNLPSIQEDTLLAVNVGDGGVT